MKTIEISNALFGALWARATEDDKSEEDILRRLLSFPSPDQLVAMPGPSGLPDGFIDGRSGVKFPQGFQVFRVYKGQRYSARASNGKWDLEGHAKPYDSLAALSVAIGAKTESAWSNWRYMAKDGMPHIISDLRDKSVIRERSKKEEEIKAAPALI